MTTLYKIMFVALVGVIVSAGYLAVWWMFEQTELGQAIINTITKEKDEE